MFPYIIYAVAFFGLLVGSVTDIKKREVPDWVNYGLIASGFGFNLLYSFVNWEFSYIVNSILGFLVFLSFSLVMFYSGQWGGGDSKMLMGLGALFGINIEFFKMIYFNIMNLFKPSPISYVKLPFAINLIVNVLLVGAAYGLLWSFVMVALNFRKFRTEVKKVFDNVKRIQKYFIIVAFILILVSYFSLGYPLNFIATALVLLLFTVFYLWIFIKATENSCMLKYVKPLELTEGDWIAEDVKVGGKHICGPKDLGIEKKQIKELIGFYKKGKIKKVLIKEGIPFVPSFLIAFILTLIYGSLILLLV
jgi:hypothetical protein